MVRRDLEADGGFAEFFQRTGEGTPAEAMAAARAEAHGLVDGMGQLQQRVPLVGKVPPWRQPPTPEDPNAPRPFAWLAEGSEEAAGTEPLAVTPPISVGANESGVEGPQRVADVSGSNVEGTDRARPSIGSVGTASGAPWISLAPKSARTWATLEMATAFRDDPLAPRTAIRGGGTSDDEGGPGDTPASVAWLRAGRGTGYRIRGPGTSAIDPRRPAAAPAAQDGPTRSAQHVGPGTRAPPTPVPWPASSPSRRRRPAAVRRSASSHWERWLEFCARIDGFPRHLSIHSGGMLVTAAPLIDIAPIERATMADRVVVQFDKRDVETLKLIKLDLLGLGMLAAMDETLQLIEHDCAVCLDLDRMPEDVPEVFAMLQAADTVGVFQVESRAQMQTLPKSKPQSLDDLVVEVAIIRPGPDPGQRRPPVPAPPAGPRAGDLPPPLARARAQGLDGRDPLPGAGHAHRHRGRRLLAGGERRVPAGDGHVALEPRDGEAPSPVRRGLPAPAGDERGDRRGAVPPGRGVRLVRVRQVARGGIRPDGLRVGLPQAVLPGPVPRRADQRPADGLLPGRGPGQRHEAPRRRGPAGRHQRVGLQDDDRMGRAGRAAAGRSCRRAASCPSAASRERWTPAVTAGWGVRLGLHLVKGIGEQHEALLDAELARGPYRSLVDVVERTDLPEEVLERLIRSGAMDSLGRPRRELLWQLREVAGASRGRMDGRTVRALGRAAGKRGAAAGRPMDLRLPATEAPAAPADHRVGADRRRLRGARAWMPSARSSALFRPALDRLGAVTNAALADRRPGRVRVGGLVVTRQHPMTAKGTVFLALEDETGMVNVTMWPNVWERLRGVVRRHALLLVDGELQREGIGRQPRRPRRPAAARGGRRGRWSGAARRRPPDGPRRDAPAGLSGRASRRRRAAWFADASV